ncbi:MAG: inositol monophosphatase [Anaerolineae bacterium]|jgi:myo-inositol-1(or 4)-monophosphatase|nr:inositol monophosphatase [Anaerolineae bacterium]MBT7074310.1 inositol monophosphatase [Anaerolineae bacterium]
MKSPTLIDIKTLALDAGKILRAGYEKTHQVEYKSLIDPVTEIDYQAEDFLLKAILGKFPTHHILTEESGIIDGDHDHIWYIDPLDGTVNYAHGVPVFCVSIAYAYKNDLKFGAVYDPMRDELFSAVRGQGATMNGKTISASNETELERSLLTTGFPYDMWETVNDNLNDYGKFAKLTQGVRRLGSAALDLCYVAAGRLEGYWEHFVQPWDVAAGGLIAEESGAKVRKINGGKNYLTPPISILAAPPALYKKMDKVLKDN